MIWQTLLIISIATEVVGRLLQRSILKEDRSSPIAYAIISQLTSGILIGIFSIINGFSIPQLMPILINLIFSPILYALTNIFIFKSLKYTEASSFTILFSTRVLWVIPGAIILLREVFSYQQLLGALLIFSSVILISWKKKTLRFSKGEVYALLAGFFLSAALVNDAFILKSFDVASYLSLAFIAPAILLAMIYPQSLNDIGKTIQNGSIRKIMILGTIYSITAITFFMAYKVGNNAAQLTSIFQVSSVITVLSAIVILKEKQHLLLKMIATVLSFIGVLLVR